MLRALASAYASSLFLIRLLGPMADALMGHLILSSLAAPLLVCLILRARPHCTLSNVALGWFAGTLAWFAACVGFGAPLVQLADRTLLESSILGSYSVLPFFLLFGADRSLFEAMFLRDELMTVTQQQLYVGIVSQCLGAWIGSFAMVLDWDEPWQQWPIPVHYGACAGICVGAALFPLVVERAWPKKKL